jgi:chorismate mutase
VAARSAGPVIKQYRVQISDNDLKILKALNKRIKLVKSLKDYKESQGLGFHDAAQEEWIVIFLSRANRGPISREGLRDIYALILGVVKREVLGVEGKRAE